MKLTNLLLNNNIDKAAVPVMLARGAIRNCSLFGIISGQI